MRLVLSFPRAVVVAALALPALSFACHGAQAQAQSPPAAAAPQPAPLTEAQVQSFLATQKELATIGDKEPEDSARTKEAAILKKNGFADPAAFGQVVDAITSVMAGIDEDTGKYVGAPVLIRKQIAAVKADKKMPAKEKAATVKELEKILAEPITAPPPGDIEVVTRHAKEIAAVLPQDADE